MMFILRDALFFVRTLKLFLPNNRYRKLKRHYDPNYVHERDKHPVRHKHFGQSGWSDKESPDGFRYRDYASYEEYVEHQRQKILELLKVYGGFSLKTVLRQRYEFWLRFRRLVLPRDARLLCLGARFGTEVEVLRDLGYGNACGLDLEPGPGNPYVTVGDFMKVAAEDSSIDMIYCNAVDHAFDLRGFFKEHARIVTPAGLVIYDVGLSTPGIFEAVNWGDEKNLFLLMLNYFKTVESVGIRGEWKTIHLRGKREQVPAAEGQAPPVLLAPDSGR